MRETVQEVAPPPTFTKGDAIRVMNEHLERVNRELGEAEDAMGDAQHAYDLAKSRLNAAYQERDKVVGVVRYLTTKGI